MGLGQILHLLRGVLLPTRQIGRSEKQFDCILRVARGAAFEGFGDADLQHGDVVKGEVRQPGHYFQRLRMLRCLRQDRADVFQNVTQLTQTQLRSGQP